MSNVDLTEEQKAEQRVAVARDVLTRLRTAPFYASPGTYLKMRIDDAVEDRIETKGAQDLKSILPEIKSCEACALGACLLAVVARDNDFDVSRRNVIKDEVAFTLNVYAYDIYERLGKIFDDSQLEMIESAFEVEDMGPNNKEETEQEDIEAAIEFGAQHEDPTDRLGAIMKNIVANKGTFIP